MNQRSGTAACIGAALLYGTALPLSATLFDGATNPLTLSLVRYSLLALLLAIWVRGIRRFDVRLSAAQTLSALAVGVFFTMVSVGQLLAIARIPVSLTTLLFYTYPAMTIVTVAVRTQTLPPPRHIGAVVVASIGLALALDVDTEGLDGLGIGFALLAAASVSSSFLLIEAKLGGADPVRAAAGSAFSASVVSVVVLFAFSELQLPTLGADRAMMVVVMFTFAAAVLSMYIGVAQAGSVRAALVLFLEPITAILLALVLLDESLTLRQSMGAAAVVAAVVISAPTRRRT